MNKDKVRLRVSSTTQPQVLAGAIAKYLVNDRQDIEIVTIGAGANQQCSKALILARRFVSSSGMNLAYVPAFETVNIVQPNGEDKDITALKWLPVEM